MSRLVLRYDTRGPDVVVRPNVAGDMVIVHHGLLNLDGSPEGPLELWWAALPKPGENP